MATSAFIGKGATVSYGDIATPTNFVAVAYVKSFGPVSNDSPQIEVTDLQSEASEYINALPTTSETTCTANRDPLNATQIFVRADQEAGNKRYWRYQWYRLGILVETATFLATVKSYSIPTTVNNEAVNFDFVLQRSGAFTWS
jgi:hypothetical protein